MRRPREMKNPLAGRGLAVLRSSHRFVRCLALYRLNESLAEHSKLLQIGSCEFVVAIGNVLHRFFEPLRLVLGVRPDDTACHNVLKELIARFVQRNGTRRHRGTSNWLLFYHEDRLRVGAQIEK